MVFFRQESFHGLERRVESWQGMHRVTVGDVKKKRKEKKITLKYCITKRSQLHSKQTQQQSQKNKTPTASECCSKVNKRGQRWVSPSFPHCVAAALSCLRNSSAGLTTMEEDSHWGHKCQGVHGALESQEGPEKRSQVGLHRELECINYGTRLHFIIIQKSFQLVIKTGTCSPRKHSQPFSPHRRAVQNYKWRMCKAAGRIFHCQLWALQCFCYI